METIYTSEEPNRKSQPKLGNTATHDQDSLLPNQLISAGYRVLNYLREKRHFTHQPITVLEIALQNALRKPLHPSGKRDEVLYQSTLKGLSVMKEDYHTAKAALQHKNEQYIAQRNFFSEEGKKLIRQEPSKGEYSVANGQRGYIVASRIEAIQKILNDYREKFVTLKPTQVVGTPMVGIPTVQADVQAKQKERIAESLGIKTRSHQILQDISSGQKQKTENLAAQRGDAQKQDMSVRSRMRR